jgi:hypothetical protein
MMRKASYDTCDKAAFQIGQGYSDIILAGMIFRTVQGGDEMEAGYHVW